MNLLEFQQKFSSEQTCRDWLADKCWGNKENPNLSTFVIQNKITLEEAIKNENR